MKTTIDYAAVIEKTTAMVQDEAVQRLAQKHGLHVLDVTWEDRARFDFSAIGPNISDMTIQVQHKIPDSDQYELSCMPVIRYPNFTDLSGDISPDEFFLLVGNQKDQPLEKITLRELLRNLRAYLHDPGSWKGTRNSLLVDDRDSHVLVSAQACFLPIPKEGVAEFNPVLFNYQSRAGDPAVLTILATREGTSVTVIDNTRDEFEAGDMARPIKNVPLVLTQNMIETISLNHERRITSYHGISSACSRCGIGWFDQNCGRGGIWC